MPRWKKHFYGPWKQRSQLSGLAKISIQESEALSECVRCGVTVKMGKGGYKFWVGGRWVTKRPSCEVG